MTTTPKKQSNQSKKTVQHQCHIHDNIDEPEANEIRRNVCVSESEHPLNEFDGKHFCIFHLPTIEKDIDKFEQIFVARLEKVEKAFEEFEKIPKNEQTNIPIEARYDFRYLWFPKSVNLSNHKFVNSVDFRGGVFVDKADLSSATFMGDAIFSRAKFMKIVDFSSAIFIGDTFWMSATFKDFTDFRSTIFTKNAEFGLVTFVGYVRFGSTTFTGLAKFVRTNFTGSADFRSAKFSRWANFSYATFTRGANFLSANFSNKVHFDTTRFNSSSDFSLVTFRDEVCFKKAVFTDKAFFNSVKFLSNSEFTSAIFIEETHFTSAAFTEKTNFKEATFTKSAVFVSSTFNGESDFNSVTFTDEALFRLVTFADDIDFGSATFTKNADFNLAIFSGDVDFKKTKFFGKAHFIESEFAKDTFFDRVKFKNEVSFNSAIFGSDSDIFFRWTFFGQEVDFQYCTSEGLIRFSNLRQGKDSKFDFQEVAFEKASRISFHTVRLRPSWFVNVDSRKFILTNINWENYKAEKTELQNELSYLQERGIKEPSNFRLLTISFRNLAANAEDFNRLEEASHFRKSAFECERLERFHKQLIWKEKVANLFSAKILCWSFFSETKTVLSEIWKLVKTAPYDSVHFLYHKLSFYGESWFRAVCLLVAVWIFFGFAYWQFGEFAITDGSNRIGFWKSFGYSMLVMTLQKPEPRPLSDLTFILYGLETILAPLQAALLAFAIRRKFMR